MKINIARRNTFAFACTFAISSVITGAAQANDKPPLRMIVPASAGSGIDAHIRAVSPSLSKTLGGQSVVIENLPGAGGVPGTHTVVRAAPDGHTLGFVSNNHVVNPSVYKKMPFDSLADITPICVIGSTPFLLVVNPKFPAKDANELQALLKAKPDGYNYASSGNGTIIHLAGAAFLHAANVEAKHIPYKGMAAMVTDIIAGVVEFGVVALPVAHPHLKSGALRAIGVMSKQRVPSIPDLPTFAEQGFADAEIGGWFAVIGPAKMARSEVSRLHQVIVAAFAMPEAQQAMQQQGTIVNPMSPEDSARYFRSELDRYATLAKKAGVTLD